MIRAARRRMKESVFGDRAVIDETGLFSTEYGEFLTSKRSRQFARERAVIKANKWQ